MVIGEVLLIVLLLVSTDLDPVDRVFLPILNLIGKVKIIKEFKTSTNVIYIVVIMIKIVGSHHLTSQLCFLAKIRDNLPTASAGDEGDGRGLLPLHLHQGHHQHQGRG